MIAGDGDDMRQLPLSMRKANLARLLAHRPGGIFIAPFEQGEIGPDLSGRLVSSDLRVWCRTVVIVRIAAAGRRIGPRSRTRLTSNGCDLA
jgi:hypothetical protein